MTFALRFRRGLFWALTGGALARLYVLGDARGWAVVGPVTLSVTTLALAAWLLHLLFHELGHLVGARLARFQVDAVTLGPIEYASVERHWRWRGLSLGGRISTMPIGAHDLKPRLRLVASMGPLVTVVLTAALAGTCWLSRSSVTSPLGIGAVIGGLVVLSAATPGRFRESTAVAGNDIDLIIGSRAVLAHWTYLAVVQGVLSGQRASSVLQGVDVRPLLPAAPAPVSAITLLAAVSHLERNELDAARSLLDDAVRRLDGAPSWVCTDVFHQRGAIAALCDHDLARATECLAAVRQHQSLDWYQDLLEACIALANGDAAMKTLRLERWQTEARALPRGRLALGGNEWILERLH